MTEAAEDIAVRPPALRSPQGEGGAPNLAPGWEEEDVAMLREAARLSMAHMQALTMELTAHAERVAVGDLTPLSRAAATESSLGFTRAARCLRLSLAMKAHARNPNAKARDAASLVDGLPPAPLPLSPGEDRRSVAGDARPAPSPDRALEAMASGAEARDTEGRDLPEIEREREIERDSWGDFPAMLGRAASDSTEGALARVLAATVNVRRRYGESLRDPPSLARRAKEGAPPETREVVPNGRPPHPIHNPGGYPNYQAYRAACDAIREQALARKPSRNHKHRRPP